MNRKHSNKKLVIIAIIAILATLIEAKFLVTTCRYINYSLQVILIEKEAQKGIWTPNGYVYWTSEQVQLYDKTLKEKSTFIESNDFATFLYHSGFSTTGMIIRIITILSICYLLLVTLNVLSATIKILFLRFKRYTRRVKHRYKKKKNNKLQKNQG